MNPVLKSLLVFRRRMRYAYRDGAAFLGSTGRGLRQARGARIVVYHGICQKEPLRFNNIFLTLKNFEGQLRFYKQYFNIVSLDDYYKGNFSRDRFNICLHFDDGYANNYRYVLPLLEQYEVPASFFITAVRDAGYDILWNDFLGILSRYGPEELVFRDRVFLKRRGRFPHYVSLPDGQGLWEMLRSGGFGAKADLMEQFYPMAPFRASNPSDEDYWLQMTPAQIAELATSKWVTIGAHGYYHNDLAKTDSAAAEKEMSDSKSWLEKTTGKPVNAFAFPYGTYTPALIAAAKRASFTRLLPLGIHAPDETLRERVIVNPYVSLTNQLFNIVEKRYDFWR